MSISFACPECRAQIEVADEFAGHDGQCPRCQKVIVIPSSKQPNPILAEAVPVAQAPREEARPKRRPAETGEPRTRPRRARSAPKQPSGPIWPWVVGVFGAVVMIALLISSFSVLVFWRRAPEPTQADFMAGNNRVTVGRLEGNRAFLQNGVFQVRSELTKDDPFDLDHEDSRCKRFEIALQANRAYVFEMDNNQFNCEVRCESPDGNEIQRNGNNGRNVQLVYAPQRSMVYQIHATSTHPATGNFTLTVREQHRPKPFVP